MFKGLWGNYKRCNIHELGTPEGEVREMRAEHNTRMTENFSQIIVRQTPNHRSRKLREPNQVNTKKLHLSISFLKLQKSED